MTGTELGLLPVAPGQPCGSDGMPVAEYTHGMTLRQHYAGLAIAAIIGTAAAPCMTGMQGAEPAVAIAALRIADALLAELAKDQP